MANSFGKLSELIYRVSQKKSFAITTAQFRNEWGIPAEGFKDEQIMIRWFQKVRRKNAREIAAQKKTFSYDLYLEHINKIRDNFDLPPTPGATNALQTLLLMGEIMPDLAPNFSNSFVFLDKLFEYKHKNVVRIGITKGAGKKDVLEWITKHWAEISKHFELAPGSNLTFQPHNPHIKPPVRKRIKSAKNKDRDQRIYELYQKTRQELGLRPGQYKEIQISKLLRKEGFGDISPENIRKIVQRQKKLRE
jgi:hypothetical protein